MISRNHVPWWALLFASGAVSLVYEVVWLRRLGLLLGGSAVAAAVTVGAFMAGLALGALVARRIVPDDAGRGHALRAYAILEAGTAIWALFFPLLLAGAAALTLRWPGLRWGLAVVLLLPPTSLLGATWPVLAPRVGTRGATGLYAANTTGAVVGVLVATFVLLPGVGVRASEVAAAIAGLMVAALAWEWARGEDLTPAAQDQGGAAPPAAPDPAALPVWAVHGAAAVAGVSALGLEVAWMRLGAVAFGATVQNVGLVLATFLAAVAVGAWAGRRWPAEPAVGLGWGLGALGVLALAGALFFGQVPYGMAALYRWGGADALRWGTVLWAMVAMGGAPVASGFAFSAAVRCLRGDLDRQAGRLYAANTVGAIAGAWIGGLWALPVLELEGTVLLFAGVAALGGSAVLRRPWPLLAVGVLAVAVPRWDARLYAVGVHLLVSDFGDPSSEGISSFVEEGWDLLYYDHGPTGAVAVGRSQSSGNVWLSVNGKVDASTGRDMLTQELSGLLPIAASANPARVLVVGLASGVTAGAVLRDERVRDLVIVELEPAVVTASHFFDHVNERPLDDPRSELIVDDARAVLQRPGPLLDVLISEPSNPWITGVSSLFTEEYWRLGRARLRPGGVFCQWVQLYGMGPSELRALVRTFTSVFPSTWLFETIEGSDVLLVAADALPPDLPLAPTLTPPQVRWLGGTGWTNTDDHPRVEFRAPYYLHRATTDDNVRLIAQAAMR